MNKIKRIFDEVKFFIRRKLIEKRFFKDVTFESKLHAKILKTSILAWIFDLKESKNIEVENFVSLLSEYSDVQITLPIRIGGHKHHLYITDRNGIKFYLTYALILTKELNLYTIGKRDNNFDREFEYELTPLGNIVLTRHWVLVLNNGINTDKCFKAVFNNRTHDPNIIFENSGFSLEITFAAPNYFYAELENYLLTLVAKTEYFYNILPVFVHIKNNLGYHLPITITCYKNSQVSSKISTYFKFANGEYVCIYSFTEFISNIESIYHTLEINEPINKFLETYSNVPTNSKN